ncbi:nucleotidyltransferase-like protein [Roseivirga pacifica]|uniref:Nucleotidyl transferase n=1 Tax=Roseivirga pacifica TaxID=1267423 RepID=A0A1I0NB80_9BACT|nr:sugar phosphate nucleotidyltransferase [Roseivirga pacifica]RKQ51045.1 nucleotidyltransferase-like protein [Roseivirga pacifica]SEV98194.1 Nucleotidyl transferase [Roseivirga pacifica]
MDLTLVVLAAGMGSRYGGNKQLDGIGPNGEIIMDYSIHDAINAGFTKVVFIIRTDLKEAFENHYAERFKGKIKMEYAFQNEYTEHTAPYEPIRKKPWGTTHAVLAAKHLINEPFVVINADDYYGQESFKEVVAAMKDLKENEYLIMGYELVNTLSDHGTVNRGVCQVDENMHLVGIKETLSIGKKDGKISYEEDGVTHELSPDTYVSMNFFGFPPSVLPLFEEKFIAFVEENKESPKAECFMPVEVGNLMKEGKAVVKVVPTSASWLGVTYKEDKEHVVAGIKQMVADGTYPEEVK